MGHLQTGAEHPASYLPLVELDLLHVEPPAPLGLVPQTILERTARVLLGDEELYRSGS